MALPNGERISNVQLKITEGLRDLGMGFSSLERICLHSGIPLISRGTYDRLTKLVNNYVHETVSTMIDENVQIIKHGEESKEVEMSGDNSWKTRGWSSTNGSYAIMVDKLVVAYECLTKNVNHTGTSQNMETVGMQRCLSKTFDNGLLCSTLTTDGDTKTATVLREYNSEHNLNATQCVCVFFLRNFFFIVFLHTFFLHTFFCKVFLQSFFAEFFV